MGMIQDERDALHHLWAERVADLHVSGRFILEDYGSVAPKAVGG